MLILKAVMGAWGWPGSNGGGWSDLEDGVKGSARPKRMISKAARKDRPANPNHYSMSLMYVQ